MYDKQVAYSWRARGGHVQAISKGGTRRRCSIALPLVSSIRLRLRIRMWMILDWRYKGRMGELDWGCWCRIQVGASLLL